MSTALEGKAAAQAASAFGKPVWVGWSLQDHGARLRSGETVTQAHAALSDLKVAAVLANCAPPEAISAAMPELVATGTPTGGYANGFTAIPQLFLPGNTKAQLNTRQDLDPDRYAAFAMKWVADGAVIVGGCCEVGPAHIQRLRDDLRAAGHQIVGPAAL
jgi:S-methylmethionine-dependent homocysteine/selenocysteine methylase